MVRPAMGWTVRLAATVATLGAVLASPAAARGEGAASEAGRFEIELLTIAPGDQLENMFGHSALRVVDRGAGADHVFNWGTLLWAPDLPQRFVAGPMTYFLGVETFESTLAYYAEENRRVSGQVLDLAPEEAVGLVSRLYENAQPDRRDYLYHHFEDNCATRIRDVLDDHTGGALRRASRPRSGRTYRGHLYFGGAPPAVVALAFDMTTNATWDREPDDWAATFLPDNLRALVARARLEDGGPLVVADRVHRERRGPDVRSISLRPGWYVLGLPALLLLAALLVRRRRRAARLAAIAGFLLLGLLSGVGGVLGILAWTMTAHADFEWNEALIHLWPWDLLLLVVGPLALGRTARRARALERYLFTRAAISAAALLLLALGVLHQQVWPLAVPILVATLAAALLARRAAGGAA